MRVELLYLDGCRGHEKAGLALEDSLAQEEHAWSGFELVAVNTDEDAQRLRFPGSPTIRVDGQDLFPLGERSAWRLGCRVYPTPDGLKDHPTAEMIRTRLPKG